MMGIIRDNVQYISRRLPLESIAMFTVGGAIGTYGSSHYSTPLALTGLAIMGAGVLNLLGRVYEIDQRQNGR